MARTQWTTEFMGSSHPPALKRLMVDLEHVTDRAVRDLSNPKGTHSEANRRIRDHVKSMAAVADQAGRDWAKGFLPKDSEKTAALFDWDVDKDINAIMATLHEPPNQDVSDAIHEALQQGTGPAKAIQQLSLQFHVDRARDVARSVYMNLYVKSALREMQKHAYELARRMEIDDHKLCGVCRILHNKTYKIDDLLALPDPLTADTHPRCRGTFVPVLNSMTAQPHKGGKMERVRDLKDRAGRVWKNVPVEYVPFLARFVRKESPPFSVVFDEKLPVDSKMVGDVLRIHPRALYDQDPRELVLESWAERLWPKYEDAFRSDYVLLTQMGLVRPSRTFKTAEEYWVSEFTAYKLNQLDMPFEIIWFKSNVKE